MAPKLNCYLLSVPFSIVIVYMIERQLFMILFSSFWTVDREKNEIFYIGKLLHNSDPTPQGVENRNILWFKCALTALHVNCMILFDKVL